MAEARFIKTVTFGGYEKEAVIKRMEFLNTQVHDLRNELRETKLLLEAYKKDQIRRRHWNQCSQRSAPSSHRYRYRTTPST
ncbi:hypothetical protein [Ruminococcus sp.]|uniref:hypothetical protein n=1 Tax=Ruminococcus sp. TaxID=41978 RepID=UPI002C77A60F|nr:hypothetical protein [Ruminococcus sp.]HOA00520.1 hypothetical protein [Ruminococcus sp.]HOH87824.1 hypothetical protein [Ruminococcus sp.]